MLPRRFALVRHVDYTGVSGVGVVAYGVVFADGHVALRWASTHPATSLWGSMDDLVAVHGHGEATSIEWLDPDADPFTQPLASRGAGRRARRVQPDPVLPEPVVEPDVTRATRPITIDPEPPADVRPEPAPARPEPAVRPAPGRPDPVRPELLGPGVPHPEPLQPRSRPQPMAASPEPVAAPPPPPPVEPPPLEPRRTDPRPVESLVVEPPAEPPPATAPEGELPSANGGRPAHSRLPSQRGAGRHRRSASEPPKRTTYPIESDGS